MAGAVTSTGAEVSVRTGLIPMAISCAGVRVIRFETASTSVIWVNIQFPPEYRGIWRLACQTPFCGVPDTRWKLPLHKSSALPGPKERPKYALTGTKKLELEKDAPDWLSVI